MPGSRTRSRAGRGDDSELVEAGANEIVGADTEKILAGFRKNQDIVIKSASLYGDGYAARKIVEKLRVL